MGCIGSSAARRIVVRKDLCVTPFQHHMKAAPALASGLSEEHPCDQNVILERYFCAKIHHFATIRMTQAQTVGMEHQTRGRLAFRRAIKRIPQNRMPERQHMHPELMRPTGLWA